MKIEIHDDDGHTYTFEREVGDAESTFHWTTAFDGRETKIRRDGHEVLWELSLAVLNVPSNLGDPERAAIDQDREAQQAVARRRMSAEP